MTERLTSETARVGMRVRCVDASGARWLGLTEGGMYIVSAIDGGRVILSCNKNEFYPDRFIPADPEPAPAYVVDNEAGTITLHGAVECKPTAESKAIRFDQATKPTPSPKEWWWAVFSSPDKIGALYPDEDGARQWMDHYGGLRVERVSVSWPTPPRTTEREATISDGWWQ